MIQPGATFGRLRVMAKAPSVRAHGRSLARSLCRCACGVEKPILNNNLLSGTVQSCGCLRIETAARTARRRFPSTAGRLSLHHLQHGWDDER